MVRLPNVGEIRRLRERVKQLEDQATKDPLTGLLNRRGLFEQLEPLVQEVQWYLKQPEHPTRQYVVIRALSLLMIDLDNFKKINDQYGHPTGDKVLIRAAQLLRDQTRLIDLIARVGGEEIVVVLVGAPQEEALKIAEKLRATIAEAPVQHGDKYIKYTASFGVVSLEPKTSADKLLLAADKALYQAKAAGRNRVSTA